MYCKVRTYLPRLTYYLPTYCAEVGSIGTTKSMYPMAQRGCSESLHWRQKIRWRDGRPRC